MATRTESVTVGDGSYDLPVWLPEAGHGPGVLLIQEIFGVGPYIRGVAADLAALGYVVAAPDLFWRQQPGWVGSPEGDGLKQAMEMGSRLDVQAAVNDLVAALARLTALPEVNGGTGALGFCLGGSMGYFLAARAQLSALVSFYGSQVPAHLDLLDAISCPVQFHFGGTDPYIPREQVAALERAVARQPDMEIHVQEDGGHAFHNSESPMFYQPGPAAAAWRLTEHFLARHLPV